MACDAVAGKAWGMSRRAVGRTRTTRGIGADGGPRRGAGRDRVAMSEAGGHRGRRPTCRTPAWGGPRPTGIADPDRSSGGLPAGAEAGPGPARRGTAHVVRAWPHPVGISTPDRRLHSASSRS